MIKKVCTCIYSELCKYITFLIYSTLIGNEVHLCTILTDELVPIKSTLQALKVHRSGHLQTP
jgi:hypothetical protein